jgi:reactive intermediate/imine deaminase
MRGTRVKSGSGAGSRIELRIPSLSEPISHYTDAVRFRDLLFVSGCAPLDEAGALVGTTAAEQVRQVFENMGKILEAAGTDFQNVLKIVVYLTDISDRTAINPVRQDYFGESRPASTLVEVSALAIPGMMVEVDAIAAVPWVDRQDGETRR